MNQRALTLPVLLVLAVAACDAPAEVSTGGGEATASRVFR
jgi:hypothetical protein